MIFTQVMEFCRTVFSTGKLALFQGFYFPIHPDICVVFVGFKVLQNHSHPPTMKGPGVSAVILDSFAAQNGWVIGLKMIPHFLMGI